MRFRRRAAHPDAAAVPTMSANVPDAPPVTAGSTVDGSIDPGPRRERSLGPALRDGARPVAHLVLEDGRTFTGRALGALGTVTGEAVFCTGMTGYQETLTDPSYAGQVVVQTAPHIGNTGINDEDQESRQMWVQGYVVRDPSPMPSSWRSRRTLDDELVAQGVVGICEIDTRALVRHLRDNGSMRCAIGTDLEQLRAEVLAAPSMAGLELASTVSTPEPYIVAAQGRCVARVVALDLGIKGRTPWHLAQRGMEVHVVPARTSAAEILALAPDGVFLSNGPGDPAATTYAHETLRGILTARVPFFGICLGNQILAHALGLGTVKLPFGHRGINHPVKDTRSDRVIITSQNHGFAVDAPLDGGFDTAFGETEVSHVSLFDASVEGLRCRDIPAFSVQYHPEAAAGPHDAAGLFDEFLELLTPGAKRKVAR
jgi:carbamoyl-phosphate synthase small subunit